MRAGLAEGADLTLPRFLEVMQQRGGKSLGAIRVSLGLASNIADVDRFLQFAARFQDQTLAAVGALTVDDANCRVIRDGS
jgi:selenocysteine lyase/cysteine desulfurase